MRWIALATGLALLAVAVAALVADEEHAERRSETRAARQERSLTAAEKRERRRLIAEQAPRRGRAERRPPSRHAQAALVEELERAIVRDARRRHRRGRLGHRVRDASGIPFVRPSVPRPPPPPVASSDAGYECVAITSRIPRLRNRPAAVSGYPYWARVDFRAASFVFCKVNPRPGEHGTDNELAFVPLPAECDLIPDR